MNWLPPGLLAAPAVLLIGLGLVPRGRSNDAAGFFGRLATLLCGAMFLMSVPTAVLVTMYGPMDYTFVRWNLPIPVCLGIHVDAVAVIMMSLISFIGLIIARFSSTYLLGDRQQERFFRWMSVTIGASLLLVMSCNLVMFAAAWMFTSYGLHQLLTLYPERTWAIWAARKKFLISRLGDVMLITALILTFRCFGSTEYTEIFAAAEAIHNGEAAGSLATSLIGLLFVLGAMTKSAQFPFHSWLPDTMETPTPVSALMHAGVINAGGFLVIRLSPLVSLSPIALDLLALIGAITALLGSVVMLTQTSIKRSLAYSTIAQMGFMMLQCGLGAFSAALLHIVAHSAYKAYAFLSCGSVLDTAARMKFPAKPLYPAGRIATAVLVAVPLAFGLVYTSFQLVGVDISNKPGGLVLTLIMTLAMAHLIWNGLAVGHAGLCLRSLFQAVLVVVVYSVAYLGIDRLVASSTSHHTVTPSALDVAVFAVVAVGFAGVFILQILSGSLTKPQWVKRLYVHAMNGFYFDIPARRLTAWFYRQAAPVQ